MFSVLFEIKPRKDQWDAYLAMAKTVRIELERTPGFVDNIHYRSLTRDGWILSLSGWRDETSVMGWHTRLRDDDAQEKDRNSLLADYRLRIGETTSDTRLPDGKKIMGLDDTRMGEGTYVTLIDSKQAPEWVAAKNPQEMALYLGFDLYSYGDCISWDIFEAVSNPGEVILLVTWKDAQSANGHAATQIIPDDARVRVARIVRDYAMSDCQEASLDHPPTGRETIQA